MTNAHFPISNQASMSERDLPPCPLLLRPLALLIRFRQPTPSCVLAFAFCLLTFDLRVRRALCCDDPLC
jgi:hypothetical protein